MCPNPTHILKNKHLHFNLDPTLPPAATLPLSPAWGPHSSKEWPICPISPPSSAHDGLGSPNSLRQAAVTVAASVPCVATHVDIFQISVLPEAPISMGLFHAVVSCLLSHFSGHLPFVPYLALSVNVPRRSFLLCSSSSFSCLQLPPLSMSSKSLSVAQPSLLDSTPT